jgi:hypothetical protein
MLLGVACAAGIATPAMAQPRDNGWTVSLVGGRLFGSDLQARSVGAWGTGCRWRPRWRRFPN